MLRLSEKKEQDVRRIKVSLTKKQTRITTMLARSCERKREKERETERERERERELLFMFALCVVFCTRHLVKKGVNGKKAFSGIRFLRPTSD